MRREHGHSIGPSPPAPQGYPAGTEMLPGKVDYLNIAHRQTNSPHSLTYAHHIHKAHGTLMAVFEEEKYSSLLMMSITRFWG